MTVLLTFKWRRSWSAGAEAESSLAAKPKTAATDTADIVDVQMQHELVRMRESDRRIGEGISTPRVFTKRKLEGRPLNQSGAPVTSSPMDPSLTFARANGNTALPHPISRYTVPGFKRGRSSRVRSITRLPTALGEVFWG
jgi:hypothetical protein